MISPTSPAVDRGADLSPARDRCPGALTLHEAADGLLARIRLPGGFVSSSVLRGLADLTEEFGDRRLELTSRGNVQIRAISPRRQERLADELTRLGLLPSATHERVRNIVASPLAGLDGTGPDLASLVAELDAGLCARPNLQALSGRFLFALDDGRGDVAGLNPDICARWDGLDRWTLLPGQLSVSTVRVTQTMLELAEAFLTEASANDSVAWRIADLLDGSRRVVERAGYQWSTKDVRTEQSSLPAGVIHQSESGFSVVAVIPLGRLTSDQVRVLAGHVNGRPARITPWRSVVLSDVGRPDSVVESLRQAQMDVGRDSRWHGVTACVGRPGCVLSLADVQADAIRSVQLDLEGERTLPIHWSGCHRRCGRPQGSHVDMLAGPDGYTATLL